MTAIETEEERARLDELYALVEAEMDHSDGSGEMPEKAEAGKGQDPFDNTRSDEGVLRFKNSFPDNPPKDVAVNVRSFMISASSLGHPKSFVGFSIACLMRQRHTFNSSISASFTVM